MTEKCSSCDQMKKENSVARKAMMDTNKNYVEVCNENLGLRRTIENLQMRLDDWDHDRSNNEQST